MLEHRDVAIIVNTGASICITWQNTFYHFERRLHGKLLRCLLGLCAHHLVLFRHHGLACTKSVPMSAFLSTCPMFITLPTRSPAAAGMADSWRQINLLGGEGHGIKLGMRWQAWFPFSGMRRHMRFSVSWSWNKPREGHPMQSLCMTLNWPVKVKQDQRSRCTFITRVNFTFVTLK